MRPSLLLNFSFLTLICLASCSAAQSQTIHDNPVQSDITITRDFVPGPFGQVHVRIAKPIVQVSQPPLILFHPTPYSGDYFIKYMRLMAQDRIVVAIDTPGYGDSDRPKELPSINDYATSAGAAIDAMGFGKEQIDLLGYHTGGLIAVELAATRPDTVRRLVLPGFPFFAGEDRKKAYEENVKPDPVETDGSHLSKKWEFSNMAAPAGLSLERGQEHFNDSVQCYPHCWQAYHAVFTYETEKQLQKIAQPVLLITINGSLKKETETARKYISDAKLLHIPEITLGGFDLFPGKYAKLSRDFLNNREIK